MKTPFSAHAMVIGLALLSTGGAGADEPPFPFLNGRGIVHQAMKTIWKAGFEALQTTVAASLAAGWGFYMAVERRFLNVTPAVPAIPLQRVS